MNIPSPPPPSRTPIGGIITTSLAGILLMALGLTWLFSNLGYLDGHELLRQGWPAILVLLGLGNLLQRPQNRTLLGPLFIAAGLWAFATQQRWLDVPFWEVFAPTAVVLVGGSVIWRALRTSQSPAVPADGAIRTFSIFSGSELRPSLPFQGAQLTAVMGGAKLDLSRTPMAHSEAAIDVFMVMGGAEIIVPPDWEVTANALCFMGGVADKRRPPVQPPTRRLYINGTVFLGGVEIKD
jgi:hypothetical protein